MIANGSDLENPRVQTVWATYLSLTWSDPQVIEWEHLNHFFSNRLTDPSSAYPILRWLAYFLMRCGQVPSQLLRVS